MTVAPFIDLADELAIGAMARALRTLSRQGLERAPARAMAYVLAGLEDDAALARLDRRALAVARRDPLRDDRESLPLLIAAE